jgi:transposase
MEDILDVYEQLPDPLRPRLCFDERPCLLVGDVITPLLMKAGKPKRPDYEFIRGEAVVALLAYNMDTGQRHVQISDTKKKVDYAQFMAQLIDTHYVEAQGLIIIQDNLNTHTKGSFYKTFDPATAKKYAKKLEFHFTPKHASWLNMAEIEFSSLSRQCLNRRIKDKELLKKEVAAWEKERNRKAVKINWSFTVQDAQEKLTRHYLNVFDSY